MESLSSRALVLITAMLLTMSVISVATASAAPELVNKEGKALVKKGFTFASGKGTFESVGGHRLVCTADSGTGEVTGLTTDKATVKFTGCETFGIKCKSAGANEGEIVVFATSLLVHIQIININVLLIKTGKVEIKCGSAVETFEVTGETLGVIAPVNKLTKSLTADFSETKGVEEHTEYENEKGETVKKAFLDVEGSGLETFGSEEAGLGTEDTLTFEEEVEVR
jgi:uncharacterized protein YunC (DUF1805 family)